MTDNNQLHVVFGASRGAGNAVVRELVRRGKRVRAVNRSGNADVPQGVETFNADATNLEQVRAACAGASAVYHCVNVPYPQWFEMLPPIMDDLIAGAAAAGARLVYIDNLYMFGEGQSPLKESNPHHPTTRKGRLRQQLAETLLAAHQSGQVQATIGRGSDFYGPGVTNALLGEQVFPTALVGKASQTVGNLDMPHTYTYIEDFAKGIATLGEREEALGRAWHIPNAETLTTRQMLALIYEEAGQPLKIQAAPKFLLTLMGLFDPMVRELKEMLYQFEAPFAVDHSDYARAFGDFPPTPHREAIQATLAWYRE
jgi:nucleoside-diphosphate-sugar epimerase